jgi:hypothetical protein
MPLHRETADERQAAPSGMQDENIHEHRGVHHPGANHGTQGDAMRTRRSSNGSLEHGGNLKVGQGAHQFARSRLNGNFWAGVGGGQAAGRYKKLGRIPEGGKRILSQFFEFLRMWRMCNTVRRRVAESLRRRRDL